MLAEFEARTRGWSIQLLTVTQNAESGRAGGPAGRCRTLDLPALHQGSQLEARKFPPLVRVRVHTIPLVAAGHPAVGRLIVAARLWHLLRSGLGGMGRDAARSVPGLHEGGCVRATSLDDARGVRRDGYCTPVADFDSISVLIYLRGREWLRC